MNSGEKRSEGGKSTKSMRDALLRELEHEAEEKGCIISKLEPIARKRSVESDFSLDYVTEMTYESRTLRNYALTTVRSGRFIGCLAAVSRASGQGERPDEFLSHQGA